MMALAVRGFYVGVRRGILAEVVLTGGILGAIVFALVMGSSVGTLISSKLPLGINLSNPVSLWGIVFIGILASFLLAKIVQKISHMIFQSPIDKVGGSLFGGTRAILLSAVLGLALLTFYPKTFQGPFQESVIGSYSTQKMDEIHQWLDQKIQPKELLETQEEVQEGLEKVSEVVDEPQ